jgi:hypothetical protein
MLLEAGASRGGVQYPTGYVEVDALLAAAPTEYMLFDVRSWRRLRCLSASV